MEPSADFPVGIWVWVREAFPDQRIAHLDYAGQVFEMIKSLGCDFVVIGADSSDERRALMDGAHRAGLRVIISCGAVHHWVRYGELDGRPADVTAVVDPDVQAFRDHPALWMYFINDIPAPEHVPRLQEATERFQALDPGHATYVPYNYLVTTSWQQARTPAISWDNFPVVHAAPPGQLVNDSYDVGSPAAAGMSQIVQGTPQAKHLALVQCWGYEKGDARQRIPSLADVRQQTFVAMACGWTDGVVLYHYHSRVDAKHDGATRHSIFNLDGSLRLGPEAQLKAFIAKARQMGQRVAGGRAAEVRGMRPDWPYQIACLRRAQQDHLMILNHDVRNSVSQQFDASTMNARQVAALVDVVTGEKHTAAGGSLALSVQLDPGDASLFEVHWQE